MPSLEEEAYWEPGIKEFDQNDLVQGSPVAVSGQDHAFSGNNIQLDTYLKTVVVKEAGGAGATLTVGIDYTVHLRTGIITRLGGGALVGDTHAWVSYTKSGNDDIAHRQLANRQQKALADFLALVDDVEDIQSYLTALGAIVSQSRTLTAGNGLSGGGDLSANRTFNLDVVTGGEVGGLPGFGAALNGYVAGLAGGAPAWIPVLTRNVQTFAVNGAWAKPTGTIVAVCIELIGAGAGGGGGYWRSSTANGGGGGGGSSGQKAIHWFFADVVLTGATVTIGAAGTGGTGSTVATSGGGDGTDGNDGGDTTVAWTGYELRAKGGRKGLRGQTVSVGATTSGNYGGTAKLPTNNSTDTVETEDMRVAVAAALFALGAASRGGGAGGDTPRAGEGTSLPGGAAGNSASGSTPKGLGGNGGGGGHVPGVSAGNGTNATGTGGTPATGGVGGTGYGAGGGGGAGGANGGTLTQTGVGNGGPGAIGYVRITTLYLPA